MRKIVFVIALLMTIFLWGAPVTSTGGWAASSPTLASSSIIPTTTTPHSIVIDIRDNRLFLRADGAGIREILKALEVKTGTRYVIHEGVPDEKRTLNLSSISLRDTDTLLRKLSLNNYIVTYDRKEARTAIYILPEGHSQSDFLNGHPQLIAIRNTSKQSPSGKIQTVKGKTIETLPQKEGRGRVSYIQGEILIKFYRGVAVEEQSAILSKYNLTRSSTDQSLSRLGYTKALIPEGTGLSSLLKELIQERQIKIPELNYVLKTTFQVNDPLYINQWYVPETRFDTAWDHLKSTKTIPVAVIDTGIDAAHPDLRNRILPGYDFVHNTSTPSDDHGHGTFVAGVIAAQADTTGIRGLYDQARILPVKVMDENGLGTYEDAAKGIVWAVDQGARVINLSIGGYGYSYLLQDAVDYALEKGCIVVAAGGNDGIDQPIYPAAYPDVIGVAALADDGKIWASSNRGKHIDVSAPGDHILSTGIHGEYAYASGTSAATPMVSALAAMIANERPDLSSSTIERLIMQSAKDLGEKGKDIIYGAGKIDAAASLQDETNPSGEETQGQTESIDTIIRSLAETSAGHQTQHYFKTLATRKSEALPIIKKTLRAGNIWEKHALSKFLQYSPWLEVSAELIAIATEKNQHWLSRQGALYALGELGNVNAGPEILHILNEPNCPEGVQQVAISTLARIGYQKAVPDIRRFTEHENPHIRLFAYRALAGFGEAIDIQFLLSSLESQNYIIRQDASGTLAEVEGEKIDKILSSVAENDHNESVRSAAIIGLLTRQIRSRTPSEKLDILKNALEQAERRTAPWIIKTILKEGGPKGKEYILQIGGRDDKIGERARAFLISSAPSLSKQISEDHIQENDSDIGILHATSTHQTLMEFAISKASSLSAPLSFTTTQQTRMREGAADEDITIDILGESVRYLRHFYRPITNTGFSFFTTARDRASIIWDEKMMPYFTQGYLDQPETTTQWGGGWQQLGRISHLLHDMSSPLHILGVGHGFTWDNYVLPSCKFENYWEGADATLRTTLDSIGGPLHSGDALPTEATDRLDTFTQERLQYRFNNNCPQKSNDDVRGWLEVLAWTTYFRSTFWGQVTFGTTGNGTSGSATTSQTTGTTFNSGEYIGAKTNTLHTMFNGNVMYIDGWTDNYFEITDRMGYVFRWMSTTDIDDWSSTGRNWADGQQDSSIRIGSSDDDNAGVRITGRFWFDTRELGKSTSGITNRRCYPNKYPNGDSMTDDLHLYFGKYGYPLTVRYNAGLLGLANRSITVKTNSGTADFTFGRKDNVGNGPTFSAGTSGNSYYFVVKSSVTLEAPSTNSSGWTFNRWLKNGSSHSTSRSITINTTSNWIPASGDIYTAEYAAPTYTVSYSANGATSGTAPASQTKTHNVNLTLATNSGNLARSGYTFAGWNTNASGTGTNYADGGTYSANASVTLYAKWTTFTSIITVTYPSSGATLTKGTNYTITWTSSNVTGNVQIDLYKGASNYQQLAASDPNDGSYPFTPLTSFADGSDYRVCISAMSGSVSNCSGYFSIASTSAPSITVTYPTMGATLTKGTNYTITWTSSNVTGNVQIDLYKGASNYQQLAASDPNDGSYPFTPLNSFADGSDYRVCISAMSGTVSNCSGNFIIQQQVTPTLTIAYPNGGESLTKGTNYTITWSSSSVTGNVQIDLYKGSSNYQQLAASDPNDGSYPFTPLNSFPDGGDYRICISAMNGSVSDCSNSYFTIQSTQTGAVSGKVTKEGSTDPIAGLSVIFYHFSSGDWAGSAQTQADGNYAISGLAPGQYRVWAYAYGTDYISEYYNNAQYNTAIPVNVVIGQTTPNIDFGLAQGGRISGVVTSDATGQPIQGLNVSACTYPGGGICLSSQTQADGSYIITGLAQRQYRVHISFNSGTNYISEYYNNVLSSSQATPVNVVAGQTTPNINFTLSQGGRISGKVTKEGTIEPISGLWVYFYYFSSGEWANSAQTQEDGTYTTSGLTPGQYRVQVSTHGTNYIAEYYDNVLFNSQSTPVNVTLGQTTSNIDFSLAQGGSIGGIVTSDATGQPIQGLNVSACQYQGGGICSSAQTQADGSYTIAGLASGQYLVNLSTSGTNYVSEYYNNVLSSSQATPVNVVAGQTTPNINFTLSHGGRVSGKVTKEGAAEPISGLWVYFYYFSSGEWADSAQTQEDGTYTTSGLTPGQYRVDVSTYGTNYIAEYYNNVTSYSQATVVNVTADQTTLNINFGLATGGSISGKVTKEGTADPIVGLSVSVTSLSGGSGGSVQTQADGSYTISGLASGQYWVQVSTSGTNYVSEYYNNGFTSNEATLVNVSANQTTPNIDFGLATGGTISGRVTKEGTADPVTDLWVDAYFFSSVIFIAGSAQTQADGTYTITGLSPTVQYRVVVRTYGTNYVSEYYNNTTSRSLATPVNVVANQTTPNIDFGLATGGRISGVVTNDATDQPIPGLNISACPYLIYDSCQGTQTQADGTYTIMGLAPGQYLVQVSTSGTNYVSEYYNNTTSYSLATPVNVTVGQTIPNIDFGLSQGGMIRGVVTSDATGQPIPGLNVSACQYSSGGTCPSAQTQADGTYTITGLAPGEYRVQVSTSGTNYVSEYYNNTTSYGLATPVNVTAGQTTPNIDFGLAQGGSISGRVTKFGTVYPISDAVIYARFSSGANAGQAWTLVDGTYTITGLAPGQYLLEIYATGYAGGYYNNVLSSSLATPVNVTAGQTTPNIDIGLIIEGKISGTVVSEATGQPIQGVDVMACPVLGGLCPSAQTQVDGTYTITGLAAANWRVSAGGSGATYAQKYYNNTTSYSLATPVNVIAGQTTPNIDFGLAQGGGISGKATKEGTTDPISGLWVYAYFFSSGSWAGSAQTQEDGTYTITSLVPGQYRVNVSTSGTNYISEYYDNVLSSSQATPVNVTAGQTTPNIDFGLSTGGSISGKVTKEGTADPIAGLSVSASSISGGSGGSVQTQVDGTYTIIGLAQGQYRVQVSTSGTNYVSEYYNNTTSYSLATPVNVTAGQTTPNIDFGLATGGSISGRVTKEGTADSIAGLSVSASSISGSSGNSAQTQADGTYTITGLAPGQYRVSVSNYNTNYAPEYYNNVMFYYQATPVNVASGQTTPNIDFGLAVGGKITGRVTKDADGQPIAGVSVSANAYRIGNGYGSAQTQTDGTYTISGLPTGNYTVSAGGGAGYIREYYINADNPYKAVKVPVTLGQTTPNIDFGLSPSGTITGAVYRESDHQPLPNFWVVALNVATGNTAGAATQPNGTYTIIGLPAGNYRVSISASQGYAAEYYNNTTQKNSAIPVPVTVGQTTPNIDFGLIQAPAGKVTGSVTDGSGQPIAGLSVYAYEPATGRLVSGTQTTGDGAYTFSSLSSGQYYIAVRTIGTSHAFAYFNNTPNRADATAVTVISDQTTPNIDFALSPGGTIAGTVTVNSSHQPIPGIQVVAYPTDPDGSYGGWTNIFNGTTMFDGTYTISGLPPGDYRVTTRTTTQYNYADKYYAQANNYGTATAIPVTAGQTASDVNIGLDAGGSITGWVKSSDNNIPLDNAYMKAYDAQTGQRVGRWTATGMDGYYEILGLPVGSYKVYAETGDGSYAAQWYDNSLVIGGATPVGVVTGQLTENINFLLVTPIATRNYTVTTFPTGLQIQVDGQSYTAPQTFSWQPGSSHTVSVTSPQTKTGETGKRYANPIWSDGGAQSHTITTPANDTTYTASFDPQYSLTTVANPQAGGTVIPADTTWYINCATVQVTATANTGYQFTSWSGSLTGSTNPSNIIMCDGPRTVTAAFGASETVTVPTVTGSASGKPGQTYSYTASGSTSSMGHTVEYQFDWKGDGTDLSAWGIATQSKTWTQSGNYNVKARTRCVTHPAIVSNWSSGLPVLINASTAVRTMPGYYGPCAPVLIEIVVTPDTGISVYAAEDSPPVGWTVSEINEAGTWDSVNKKVKWGPFFDNKARTLSYKATPPCSETGKKDFTGSASFNGLDIPIGGASEIDKGTYHPADTTHDYRIVISECTSYGFAWKTGATWGVDPNPIPIGYMTNACYMWKIGEVYHFDPSVTPPYVTGEGTSASTTNSVPSSVKNADKSSDRRSSAGSSVSVSVKSSGQSRRLLTGSVRGSRRTWDGSNSTGWYGIKVEVTPVKGVQGYAVEETLPAGTEVQGINNSGNWDRTNGKVKWGPFLDNMPRTLQYQIRDTGAQSPVVSTTGPSSASSSVRTNTGRVSKPAATLPLSLSSIRGVASFDGVDVATVSTGSLALDAGEGKNAASLFPATWMDFDGDGRSDLTELSEGTIRVALMSGEQEMIDAAKYNLPSTRKILGYGDWDGDGRADILLGDGSGSIRAWLMEGTKVREERTISTLPAGVKPLGIGDVNGDGIADLLWRDGQGLIHAEVSEISAASPELLNAAGKTDSMDGTAGVDKTNALSIPRSPVILGWMDSQTEALSLGDYDGDGRSDILWRDGNSALLIMLMEEKGLRTIHVPMIAPTMMPIGTGDMNGDGRTDILWQDAAGSIQAWLMNGANQPTLIQIGQPTRGWEVIGMGDYDGDGIAEILWTYRSTGEKRITTIDAIGGAAN